MEQINGRDKKITTVHNNSLTLKGLEKLNNKKVDVIIIPHQERVKKTIISKNKKNQMSLKGKVTKYEKPFEPAIAESEWEVNN